MITLFSCGSSHHEYIVDVDEVQFSTDYGEVYPEDYEVTQVFEVVPGTYKITADKKSKGIYSGSEVNITLKLKLLRPVVVKNMEAEWIGVQILDANDKPISTFAEKNTPHIPFRLGKFEYDLSGPYLGIIDCNDKDAWPEMIEFLQSPAGTIAEFTFGGPVGMDYAKRFEDAAGVRMVFYHLNDKTKLDPYMWNWKE